MISKTTTRSITYASTLNFLQLAIVLLLLTGSAANAQLLQWNTFANTGTETTEPSVFNDANIGGPVNLTQGTITAAANGNRFGGSGWFNTGNTPAGNTLAEAVTGNDYIQFIVTPNSGFSFTPTALVFTWDRSGTGPSSVTLRSSDDGFAADLGSVTGLSSGGVSTTTVRTLAITTLTNITTATTFRLYGYGATATGGTGGFDNASSVVDVQLNGTTAATCTAPVLTINSTTNTCTGFSNGAIDINVSAGIQTVTYLWSNSSSTEDISGVAAGTYTATVTATGGCSATISATVAAIALPAVNFSGLSAAICINATSLLLTGNQAPAGTFTGAGITDNANATATFNPVAAGVGGPYNITYSYTDISTGCSNSQTQTVTVNDVPNVAAISPVSNTCPTSSFDLSTITLVNSGAAGTSTYFATLSDATNNVNAISANVSATGTYFIRVTTAQGCFDVESVSVTITGCGCANPPAANAGNNFSICANAVAQLNGSISGGATSAIWGGGAGGIFTPNDTTLNATYTPTQAVINSGSITLTLTTNDPDTAGPCVAGVSTVTITFNALPGVAVNPSTISICAGNNSGNITASGASTYAWSPSDGSLNATTGATVIAAPLSSTTYTVIGTDANGCANTATVAVTVNPLPLVLVTPNAVSICNGSSTGTINASGAATYTWENASGLSSTTGSSVIANPVSTTTYTVTGTDANNCSATATLQVIVNALPTVTLGGTTIICNGSSNTLDAGAGFSSYSWSTGASTQSILVSAAGTYTVTVVDANGCSNSASKTMTVSNPPVLSATSTASTCNNSTPGTIDLTATGGTPCNANAKGLLISKISANPGGSDLALEFVELKATKDIDFSVTPYTVIFANNGTATTNGWIAGGSLTYAFQISTGTAVAGGVYYVGGSSMPPTLNRLRAIDITTTAGDGGIGNVSPTAGVLGNGGTSADAVAVFNLPVASLTSSTVPDDAIFYGNNTSLGAAVVSGGTQGFQLPINDYYAGGKLQAGSFYITGDIFAASDRIVVATGVYDVQSNTFSTSRSFANNSLLLFTQGSSSITLTNTQPYTYSWSNSATSEDISGLAAGDYTVTVTDCNGCTTTISKTVINVAAPVVSIIGLAADICVNAAAITITGSNAPSGTFTGTGITDNANGTASFNPATAGVGGPYSITYSYTDPVTGCTGTHSQNITVNGLPDIQPINGVTNNCPTPTIDLSAIVLINNGVAGTASYFATLADANNNVNSISAVVNTSGTYYIRVTTANGCYDVELVTVTITGCGCSNPPTASAGSNFSICANSNAPLNGSIGGGASTLLWSGGGGTFSPDANTANAIYTPTPAEIAAGTITLTITTDDPDGTGSCVAAFSSVVITINALPVVSVNPISETVCSGSSTGNITASGASTYTWAPSNGSLNATNGAVVIASPTVNTIYTVTGTDGNGCQNTATVTVNVNALPSLNVTPSSPSICYGSATGLTVTGASTYTWANAAGLSATTGDAVTANPTATTIYTVTGTDANGCASTVTVEVTVNALPVVNIAGSSSICNGSSALLDAGAGYVSYLWSTGETTQTITTAAAGTYTVNITDANGCENTASKVLSVTNPPVVSAIPVQLICQGATGSINISVAGGTPCATNSPGLIISKLLPNPGGVDSPFEFVELVATKNIDFSVTPYSVIFSNNGTATVNGWKAGGAITYGFEITTGTAVAGGVYYVGGTSMLPVSNHLREINTSLNAGDGGLGNLNATGVLGNGGTTADGIAVFNSNIASITSATVPVDALIFGSGLSPVVSGGADGYQLPVNDIYSGGKVQSTSFKAPEAFSGEFIDATGTFDAVTNTFTIPRTFAINLGFNEGVSGVTVNTAASYYFNWSNGATTQNITNVGAGTYTVTVTDCNGCSSTATSVISIITPPKPYLSIGDTAVCSTTSELTIEVNDSGYYAGGYPFGTTYDFVGYSGAGLDSTYTLNSTGFYYAVVKLPIADYGGCTDSTAASNIQFGNGNPFYEAPQINLDADSVKCFGESSGSLTGTIFFGGNPTFRYQWYNSSNNLVRDTVSGAFSDVLQGMPAGYYYLDVIDHQDSLQPPYCQAQSFTIYLGEPDVLAVTENIANHVDVLCNGSSTGALGIIVTGGTQPYAYSWSNGVTTQDLNGIAAGTYSCTITDAHGCTTTIAVTITQQPAVTVNILGNTSFCAGTSSTLDAGAGFSSYNWSTGAATQTITINTAGTFTVTVTNVNGCSATDAVTTTINPLPNPTIAGANAICIPGTTILTANVGYNAYNWSTGASTQSATVNGGGPYIVTVTDGNGCSASVSKTLQVSTFIPTQPGAILGAATICKGSTLTYSIAAVAGATSYNWTVGAGASVTAGQGTISVSVTFTNAAIAGSVAVTAINSCGTSAPRTLAYVVSGVLPTAPLVMNGSLYNNCNKTNVPYSCSVVANATGYTWTVPAGVTILTGQGTNAITVKYGPTFTGSGIISVVAVNGCGTSAALVRTTNAKTAQPVISGQNWACKNQQGLVYSVAPVAGATYYTWTIVSGSTIVSGQGTTSIVVNWGNISGVIYCKANNGCGSSLPATKPVSFTCKDMDSAFDNSKVIVYPNPASTSATLQFESLVACKGLISIYDLLGQEQLRQDIDVKNGDNQVVLNLANLPKGIYSVMLHFNGFTSKTKLVVQ